MLCYLMEPKCKFHQNVFEKGNMKQNHLILNNSLFLSELSIYLNKNFKYLYTLEYNSMGWLLLFLGRILFVWLIFDSWLAGTTTAKLRGRGGSWGGGREGKIARTATLSATTLEYENVFIFNLFPSFVKQEQELRTRPCHDRLINFQKLIP